MSQSLELAVVGNCQVAALVDRWARIVWACVPRFDGDPVFCGLLRGSAETEDDGCFSIDVAGATGTEQRYLRNTAILETIIHASDGSAVRILDFVPRFRQRDRVFRPMLFARRIEPVAGTPLVTLRVRPLFNYGSVTPERTFGSNHIRFVGDDLVVRLTTSAPVSCVAEEAAFALTGPVAFVLGPDESYPGSLRRDVDLFMERTQTYWHEWCRYLSVPFEWQDVVIRAAITLKLCSFEDTGGIVAALTTSIPEMPRTERNWDYRFCWLRDSYFTVQALNRLGATLTMEDYLRYISTVVSLDRGRELKPVYALLPGQSLAERIEPQLRGYRDFRPVRVGNDAVNQRQNDSYGSVILALAQMFFDQRLPRLGDLALFHQLERLGEQAVSLAFEPDAGLWEYRGRLRVHTHSAAMCWAACDRLAKIAAVLGERQRQAYWLAHAIKFRNVILERAWNGKRGCLVESFGGEALDASLLQLHEIGMLAADDQRYLATLSAIERELKRGNYLMRYVAADDFGEPENAFNICGFWYVDALAAVGRTEEAREIFTSILASRNHVGLLAEDTHPATGELWGNFPQTYSMVGLILTAMRLSKSWDESIWRGS